MIQLQDKVADCNLFVKILENWTEWLNDNELLDFFKVVMTIIRDKKKMLELNIPFLIQIILH